MHCAVVGAAYNTRLIEHQQRREKSQVDDVIRYIQNQEIHHTKETFLDECRKFLNAFEIEWDEQYIFKELE